MDPREELAKRRADLLKDAEGLLATGERSEQTEQNLAAIETEISDINARMEQFVRVDEARAASEALELRQARAGTVMDDRRTLDAPTDLGGLFVESQQYRSWLQTGGKSGVLEVPTSPLQLRVPLETGDPGAAGLLPPTPRGYAAAPTFQNPLTDLVGKVQVSQNVIDWVTYPSSAPLAGIVPEGEQKPESTAATTVVPVALDTIAHWSQATRQLLEDSPAARQFITQNLVRGVGDKIEANVADALTGASASIPDAEGADLLSAIRVGIASVETAGYRPTAIAMNPADYAALDIQVMTMTLLGPTVRPSYWGLPIVPVGAITEGTAYVGAWADAMVLLNRTGVNVYITDSHANTFTANVFTILAEARAKALVSRPEALAECSATP